MKKYSLAVLCAALSAVLALSGCNVKTAGSAGTTPTGDEKKQSAAETTKDIYSSLPVSNFGGREIKIINSNMAWARDDMVPEELNGEILNDTLYERNSKVEERLNIKLSSNEITTDSEVVKTIKNAVAAGDHEYDIANIAISNAFPLVLEGMFLNVYKIPNVDFTAPWWDDTIQQSITVNNLAYALCGDMSLVLNEGTYLLYYNKDMAEDYKLGGYYEKVESGGWTLDAIAGDIKTVAADLDGDGQTTAVDRFGMNGNLRLMSYLMIAGGDTIVQLGKNNTVSFNGLTERQIEMYDKILSVMGDVKTCYLANRLSKLGLASGRDWKDIFRDGQSLFHFEPLGETEYLRKCSFGFGILPLPKYDESQSDYISPVVQYVAPSFIPVTTPDAAVIGTVLENLNAESYRTLRGAYYNTVLIGKMAQDEESVRMLDIIFGNRVFNMATFCDWGGLSSTLNNSFLNGKTDIVSAVEAIKPKVISDIDTTMKFYESKT